MYVGISKMVNIYGLRFYKHYLTNSLIFSLFY